MCKDRSAYNFKICYVTSNIPPFRSQAFNVLSFGAEAEEEEEDLEKALGENKGKAKSAHDLAKYGDITRH